MLKAFRLAFVTATLLLIAELSLAQAPEVLKIEPPNWWPGHSINPVRLLLTGSNLKGARLQASGAGVRISGVPRISDAGTYLFVDLVIAPGARPGPRKLREIVQGMVKVKQGQMPYLELGNLHSVKDWGYARDYVHGMWLMAQADTPGSYILATGCGHRIEDFVRETADVLGITDAREVVRVQAGLTRPPEQTPLVGDPHRAYTQLGWAHTVSFRQLVELMVEHELQRTLD